MEFYNFLRGVLAWTVTMAVLWPLNVPLAVLAFKVQNGARPIDMEPGGLWYRAAVATFLVALASLGLVILDYALIAGAEAPAGLVHLFLFMLYVLAVVWLLHWSFGLDDLGQGLSLFVAYIYLPVLILFVLNAMFGFWDPVLGFVEEWLPKVT